MIQERIDKLKKESENAEALLMENIKSISVDRLVSSIINPNQSQNKLAPSSGLTILSLAKIVLSLGTGISTTSKLISRINSVLSFLK